MGGAAGGGGVGDVAAVEERRCTSSALRPEVDRPRDFKSALSWATVLEAGEDGKTGLPGSALAAGRGAVTGERSSKYGAPSAMGFALK